MGEAMSGGLSGGPMNSAMGGTEWLADVFGVGEPPRAAKPPSPTEDRARAEAEAAKEIEARRRRLAKGGRQSTIHSLPSLSAIGQPALSRKELLGD